MNTFNNLPLLLLKHKIYRYFKIYIVVFGNKQRESQIKSREGSLKINEPKDRTLQFQIEIKAWTDGSNMSHGNRSPNIQQGMGDRTMR